MTTASRLRSNARWAGLVLLTSLAALVLGLDLWLLGAVLAGVSTGEVEIVLGLYILVCAAVGPSVALGSAIAEHRAGGSAYWIVLRAAAFGFGFGAVGYIVGVALVASSTLPF